MTIRPHGSGRRLTTIACALLGTLVTCFLGPAAARVDEDALITRTEYGWVQGARTRDVNRWLGIHYAGSPAGDHRWTPPRPPGTYGTRQAPLAATSFAKPCPQNISPFGNSIALPVTGTSVPGSADSEDCLALNIYAPADSDGPRPVFIWIHGGSNVYGEGSGYDPTPLVRRGAVVVTINYRLGALGWLAAAPLDAATPNSSGNYGLLDQQYAMRWVRRNIAAFGGDPDRVTIGGESAGGLDTCANLASPTAHGLFGGAIAESGCVIGQTPQPIFEAVVGTAFAEALHCTTAACLRAAPIGAVLEAEVPLGFGPVAGPNVSSLPVLPIDAFRSGRFNRVPVLAGTNRDEGRLFVPLFDGVVTSASYDAAVAGLFPTATTGQLASIKAAYPISAYAGDGASAAPGEAVAAIITDSLFVCTGFDAERALAQEVPLYAYEFRDRTAPELFIPPTVFPYGAAHASELQYIFAADLFFPNVTYATNPQPLSDGQRDLAHDMRRYWANFIATGNPNRHGEEGYVHLARTSPLETWARFWPLLGNVQALQQPRPRQALGYASEHQCGFWNRIGLVSGL